MSSSDVFYSNGSLNCKSEPRAHFVPIEALPAAEGHSEKKEIPFRKCGMCPYVTKKPYKLRKHRKSWHISSSELPELPICPHCGRGFRLWNCAQAHINKNETRFKFNSEFGNLSGAQFTCMICGCGKKFCTTIELMKHQIQHKNYKKQSMLEEYYATEFGKKHLLTSLRNVQLQVECEMTDYLFKKEPLATEITNHLLKKEPLATEMTNHLLKEEPLASEMTNGLLKREPLATEKTNHLLKKEPLTIEKTNHLLKKEPLTIEKINHLLKKEPLTTEKTNHLLKKEPLITEKTNHSLKKEPLASEMTNCLLKKEPLATTEPMAYCLHDRRSLKATTTNEETLSSVPFVQIPKSDGTEDVLYLFSTSSRRVLDTIDLSIEDVVNNEL